MIAVPRQLQRLVGRPGRTQRVWLQVLTALKKASHELWSRHPFEVGPSGVVWRVAFFRPAPSEMDDGKFRFVEFVSDPCHDVVTG